jgi:hypothetical protein
MDFKMLSVQDDATVQGLKRFTLTPNWVQRPPEEDRTVVLLTANPRVIEELSHAAEVAILVSTPGAG